MVVSRSFRRILTRNARDGCFICSLRLFCRFVLQGLTTFMCRPTQSSVRLLPSEVNWSLRIAANPFFSSIWWMQNILSFAGRLRRSPHQCSPVITCTNGVNLDTRILDKVFAQSLTLTSLSNYYSTFYHVSWKYVQKWIPFFQIPPLFFPESSSSFASYTVHTMSSAIIEI